MIKAVFWKPLLITIRGAPCKKKPFWRKLTWGRGILHGSSHNRNVCYGQTYQYSRSFFFLIDWVAVHLWTKIWQTIKTVISTRSGRRALRYSGVASVPLAKVISTQYMLPLKYFLGECTFIKIMQKKNILYTLLAGVLCLQSWPTPEMNVRLKRKKQHAYLTAAKNETELQLKLLTCDKSFAVKTVFRTSWKPKMNSNH